MGGIENLFHQHQQQKAAGEFHSRSQSVLYYGLRFKKFA